MNAGMKRNRDARREPPTRDWQSIAAGFSWPIAVLGGALFSALALLRIFHHVMWRDEWRAWLIARDSSSLSGLFSNLSYDGHPALWHLCLYFVSRFTSDPLAMQLFHVAIAAAAVTLVIKFAPFGRWTRWLFALGYFPFFEYAIISRGYGMTMLLAVCACILLCRRPLPPMQLAAVLALMAQTSVYGMGLAFVLAWSGAWIGMECGCSGGKKRLVPAGLLLLAGGILAAIQMLPGPDPYFVQTWANIAPSERILRSLGIVWRALVPIPALSMHYWNTNLLDAAPLVQSLAGLALLISALILYARRRVALMLLSFGAGGLLLISAIKFAGFSRHHGHLFLLLLAAEWLTLGWMPPAISKAKLSDARNRMRSWFFGGVLVCQAVAGLAAATGDWLVPFSGARETAQFIAANYDRSRPVLGHFDYCASSVSGYLRQPVFYPAMNDFATYNTQNGALRRPVTLDTLFADALRLMREHKGDVLLVLSEPNKLPEEEITLSEPTAGGNRTPVATVKLVKHFDRSAVTDEAFRLYRVEPLRR
jgi:hypothetical protein